MQHIGIIPGIITAAGDLFRKLRLSGLIVAGGAVVLGLSAPAAARQDGSAQMPMTTATTSAQSMDGPPALALPRIKTHAPAGFRFYRPGYRPAGNGALVTVQLCRLPGWAAAGPQHLRVERLDAAGHLGESHERYLPRLGERSGNNCSSVALPLDAVPNYGETINICAISGRGSCL